MLDEKSHAPSLGHARHAFLNSLCGAGKHDGKAVMGREVALSPGAERTWGIIKAEGNAYWLIRRYPGCADHVGTWALVFPWVFQLQGQERATVTYPSHPSNTQRILEIGGKVSNHYFLILKILPVPSFLSLHVKYSPAPFKILFLAYKKKKLVLEIYIQNKIYKMEQNLHPLPFFSIPAHWPVQPWPFKVLYSVLFLIEADKDVLMGHQTASY